MNEIPKTMEVMISGIEYFLKYIRHNKPIRITEIGKNRMKKVLQKIDTKVNPMILFSFTKKLLKTKKI